MADPTEEEIAKMSPEEIAELQKQNCIFCKIASKEIPAKIIHEDSDVLCVLDINPVSEGHILVLPKKHYMILPHVPDDILQKMFKSVKLMSQTLLKTLQCKGTSVFIANGAAAGQRAPHVLVHVFPRKDGDGVLNLPNYEMNDEQLSKLKESLDPIMRRVFGKKTSAKIPHSSSSPKIVDVEPVDVKPHVPAQNKSSLEDDSDNDSDIDADEESDDDQNDSKSSSRVTSKKSTGKGGKKTDSKKDSKDSPAKPSSKSSTIPSKKKVDLDDIARLFG